VPTLREDSTISTIGARPASGPVHKATSSRQDAKWYSDQITKLEAQLPAINGKIAQLQAGINGKFTGDSQSSTRPKYATFGDWQIELAQLQKQRDDIQARIDALRDQARRQGIPPNVLP
jgi:peptidoglycan hydrolase CwlO-like protein